MECSQGIIAGVPLGSELGFGMGQRLGQGPIFAFRVAGKEVRSNSSLQVLHGQGWGCGFGVSASSGDTTARKPPTFDFREARKEARCKCFPRWPDT